jgi:beta-N-acetylhexosaminidase
VHRPVTHAAILGCAGTVLGADERAFFAEARPWGFILFRRNVESPEQVRRLTADLRDAVGWDAPILVDQEGGRVQRLGPPHWRKYPPGEAYLKATNDLTTARELARLSGRLMAYDLKAVGVNIDCAPVLDVPTPGAHDIIGDRAYAKDPSAVAQLGRAVAEGLLAGGVLPVIKHMPGHGRAFADSHKELPTVQAELDALDAWDFAPFKALSDMPIGMTAHIVFPAIDAKRPATQSKAAIRLIRERLGFSGLLLSDDLCMNALSGDLTERARKSLKAGCDLVIHWTGDRAEMEQVMAGVGKLKGGAARRAEAALSRIVHTPEPLDVREAEARFDALLAGRLTAAKGPDVGEAQAPE